MNTHFEKITGTFILLFFILLTSCAGIGRQTITENSKTDTATIRTVQVTTPLINPNNAYYNCPPKLQKLCGAYGMIQNRYIRRMSNEELTNLFVRGAFSKLGRTPLASIPTAPFTCAENTQKLCDAFDAIQNSHNTHLSDTKLTEIFIEGALENIKQTDPYSKYNPLYGKDSHFGNYSGIGLISDKDKNFPSPLVVRRAIKGNPAERAGMKRGDRITHVNGISLSYKNDKDSNDLIKGRSGTKVKLTIIQGCPGKTRTIILTRQTIRDMTSGQARYIEGRYVYVHLENFVRNSSESIASSIEDIEEKYGTIKGLVVDLRDNPGGSVFQATKFVGLFVDKGDVLYEQNQDGRYIPWKVPKGSGDILFGRPIVILVNDGSASASEIVAGAMQDFKRAMIVGTNTYGKGVMQTKLFLKDQSTFDLTIAYTFTPNRRAINTVGIQPDIIVKEGVNESCTGDEQLKVALKILQEKGNEHVVR